MTRSQIRKYAFIKSIPIMCSYIFVSMAYGIMMEDAGFKWYYSLLVSLTVYTGAFQFVLITFLSSGASIITVALTALLMNSRQSFYSLTFLEDFKKMGKRMLYMIHTMTDETYAVNCTLELPQKEKEDTMFLVAFFSRCYWMIGSVLGGMLGQLIPWDMEGIDFCMTALFVIIFIDQWEKADRQTYTGFSWSWDRHYLPDHIWGFRFYASGTFTYIRIISGVTEEKGGSIDEYRKNIDHDRSFCSLYLLFEGSSVSGFRRITEDAGLAGPIGKNTSLSDHGSADRLLFERCGK